MIRELDHFEFELVKGSSTMKNSNYLFWYCFLRITQMQDVYIIFEYDDYIQTSKRHVLTRKYVKEFTVALCKYMFMPLIEILL